MDGSGVVVSPGEVDYSYILTAKHNLKKIFDNEDTYEDIYLEANEINVISLEENKLEIIDRLLHPSLDLAILVTSTHIPSEILISKDLKQDERAVVIGYPETRNEKIGKESLRDFPGKIHRTTGEFTVVSLDDTPNHVQLVGVSGGGLFKERDNEVILCGVQVRFEGNPAKEHHGKVECIPLCFIDEIISSKDNKNGYVPIYPEHFLCFSKSQPAIFRFEAVQTPESVKFLKGVLQLIATDLRKKSLPKPIEIYEKYSTSLLVNNAPGEDIFHPFLWSTYLEFLVLASIIDQVNEVDFTYLEKENSKRRFLFSASTNNWTTLLRDIYSSDLRGLSKDGIIIISTRDQKSTSHLLTKCTLKHIVTDIGRMPLESMRIDNPMINPASEFKLYHWSGLHHHCVINKEDEYSEFFIGSPDGGMPELIEKIRREYNAFMQS
jgi:hypothetical protein